MLAKITVYILNLLLPKNYFKDASQSRYPSVPPSRTKAGRNVKLLF